MNIRLAVFLANCALICIFAVLAFLNWKQYRLQQSIDRTVKLEVHGQPADPQGVDVLPEHVDYEKRTRQFIAKVGTDDVKGLFVTHRLSEGCPEGWKAIDAAFQDGEGKELPGCAFYILEDPGVGGLALSTDYLRPHESLEVPTILIYMREHRKATEPKA